MITENSLKPKEFEHYFQISRDLPGYLLSLSKSTLQELYQSPAACICIFRTLPKLAQQYVLRMLYVELPVPHAVICSWGLTDHRMELEEISSLLKSLQIWIETTMSGGLIGLVLNHKFRHHIKVALLGGGKTWTNCVNIKQDNKPKTEKDLDEYALNRWEAILQFLTDGNSDNGEISVDTIKTLTHAGLMEENENDRPSITNRGFQFLLLDTASQVWFFILKYLETVEPMNLNLVECLSFLFSLSLATLEKDYSTQGLSEPMLNFVQHIREFGLLNQRSRKAQKYYPTKLAVEWYSSKRKISWDTGKHKTGFLFVETNYRVYAYSTSELQLALVAMFTQFLYRLPNVVVAQITRESVNQALRNGISSDQIISFMQTHLHPHMNARLDLVTVGLPPTVVDQIRLWELERKRLVFTESVLYNQFLSRDDYNTVKEYAYEKGYLVYSSDQKRIVVVTEEGHGDVKKFWKKHSKGVN